ncbi:MAG: hypothetical protein KZQ86_05825, partial [Candidatus Thiodiazotropha sp. (ex Lucinoma kastoroae)]|nr:hypothetical protein [Candidatus Thiodiazotropha sp. (ex Lucinoma kastoroae)]
KLVPMELGNLNSVKIFKDTEDDYGVTEPVKEQRLNHNEVYIECDSTVSASDQCHIAVGMGDRVAFSYPTEPNMNHTLAINPRIYLMATSRVVTGDISDTMRSNAVLLDFKDGNEERFEYTKDNRFVRDAMKQ